MNLTQFKDVVSTQGLAKSSHWVCRIQPPKGMTSTNAAISNLLSNGGNRVNVNLPGVDALDSAVDQINNLGVNLGNVNVGTNFNVPTLGFALTNTGRAMETLDLFCHACAIPARDIVNSEFREYGEPRSLAVRHSHSDLTVSYYCSEDLRERLFFERWQDLIFNPMNKQHSYYNDYIGFVEIVKYNSGWSKQTATYKFMEAYPTNVGETSLSYEGTDLVKLDITFKFRNFERTK